ncbi:MULTISPECIES: hypothetical protein [Anaerotignum]|jgi:hypothetical protein|uniref:hypothetical protein n=1 Tax=Anaerotignum TaxID=2039240 RepID=UPI0026771FFC|nr:hypothetical protein [Anaerotignum lactatifermentans]
MIAYYCFVNFGMLPHQYAELPYPERVLIAEFVTKEIHDREQQRKEMEYHG